MLSVEKVIDNLKAISKEVTTPEEIEQGKDYISSL